MLCPAPVVPITLSVRLPNLLWGIAPSFLAPLAPFMLLVKAESHMHVVPHLLFCDIFVIS
jgi:hypothetical protein